MAKKEALPGKRRSMFSIPIDDLTIVTDPDHPLYKDDVHQPLKASFVRKIAARGVKKPLEVTPDGDELLVVDGRTRLRALYKVNQARVEEGLEPIEEVLCLPAKGNEKTLIEYMVDANVARKKEPAWSLALTAASYIRQGATPAQAAELMDVSEACIVNWQRYANLSVEIHRVVREGHITMSRAIQHAHGKSLADQKEIAEQAEAGTLKKPKPRKPSTKKIREIADQMKEERYEVLLCWAAGICNDEELCRFWPDLFEETEEESGEELVEEDESEEESEEEDEDSDGSDSDEDSLPDTVPEEEWGEEW